MFTVNLKRDEQIVASRDIRGYICKIGRSPVCNIVLDESYISSEHLVIIVIFGQIFLIDRSLNGVFVNEQKIKRNTPIFLKADDEVRLGPYSITIENFSDNLESRTVLYFENLRDGIDIQNIMVVSNSNGFLQTMTDAEFDLPYFQKKYLFEDFYRDELLRALLLKSRKDQIFLIFFSNSIYYNQDFSHGDNKGIRFGVVDYIIFFLLAIIFLLLGSLIIYILLFKGY
ncbi:MAG: FHA domain-containing protein [Myxococcota bacterium]